MIFTCLAGHIGEIVDLHDQGSSGHMQAAVAGGAGEEVGSELGGVVAGVPSQGGEPAPGLAPFFRCAYHSRPPLRSLVLSHLSCFFARILLVALIFCRRESLP